MFSGFCRNALNPLLLRLVLAAVFIYHGLNLVTGPEHQWGASWMPGPDAPPALLQMAAAWGELIGGIALAVGFLTRLAALGIIVIMIGAITNVHLEHGFDITKHGYEYNVVIITICICLLLGGPGPFAVDRLVRLRRKTN
jgi:putative oxidoreductase